MTLPFAGDLIPEAAAHQLPMRHEFRCPCPTRWAASQSYLPVVFPGLVNSVLPTTLLRYLFVWVCPGDLKIMLSTKAAHAAPL